MKAKNIVKSIIFLVFATVARGETAATKYELDAKQSPVTFLAVGKPGFLRIKGEGANASGAVNIAGGTAQGVIKVHVADFKTGIDMRDEHMKERYLEVGKFPEASLTLDPLKVSLNGKESGDFTGQLTMKGKTQPVKGTVSLETSKAGAKVDGEAKFHVKLTDFDVGVPKHLGVTVAEDVEVTVVFSGDRKAESAH